MNFFMRTAVMGAVILLAGCGTGVDVPQNTSQTSVTTDTVVETSATAEETKISSQKKSETSEKETTTTAEETSATTTAATTSVTSETTSEDTVLQTEAAASAAETTAVTTSAETTKAETSAAAIAVTTASETTVPVTTTAVTTVTTVTTAAATSGKRDGNTIEIDGRKLTLTFSDDFNGTVLDSSKWERVPEWERQDLNNVWDDDMSYLDGDGRLVIKMMYDEGRDAYLSGGVRTKGKFEQTYGYYEIKCRLNQTNGYWTAFWLMYPQGYALDGNGSTDTEIDIMEFPFYSQNRIFNTIHWDGYGEQHKSVGSNTVIDNVGSGFHTFGLLWDEEGYTFYTDGKKTWHTEGGGGKVCDVPLYIKVTSEYGSWSGGIDSRKLPDYFLVDYVRAYSLEG